MTRVIHTGDTHLGYRQYHSPERRRDFLAAFRRVVEDAIAGDVDAVVHAGDLFHDRSPALADVHGAIRLLRDLRDADVPFLAVVGNHERTRGSQWLDLFQTLGLATRLDAEPTTVGDVAIYGLDFVPRSKRDDLTYEFAPHDAAFAVLVAHGLFTPFNAEWNTKGVLSTSSVDFDAMLLGDDHQADTARVEGTWVTYCGSTERVSAAERDERGYNVLDFGTEATNAAGATPAPGEGVSIRRRGIETRPFVVVDVELAASEGAERVRERLGEEAIEDAVVVVSIEGEGNDLKPARIEEFARERGALVARVTDRRELEAAELEAVQFADPDAAVEARIRKLGLSEAALAVDETVRGDVADSNVRDRVRERIEDLLDEPDAFEPGEPVEGEESSDQEAPTEMERDGATDDETETTPVANDAPVEATAETALGAVAVSSDSAKGDAGTDETTVQAASGEDEADDAETVDETPDETDDETPDEPEESAVAPEGDESDRGPIDDRESGDGQVTMEDYL